MTEWTLTFYEGLSLTVALLAALISFVSLYRTHRVSVRQIDLQRVQADLAKFQHELLLKEEAAKTRADIRVEVVKRGKGHRMVFKNVGKGAAREVFFEPVLPDDGESFLVDSEIEELFPISQLRPGQDASMIIAITLGSPSRFVVKISWLGETGQREVQEIEVGLS